MVKQRKLHFFLQIHLLSLKRACSLDNSSYFYTRGLACRKISLLNIEKLKEKKRRQQKKWMWNHVLVHALHLYMYIKIEWPSFSWSTFLSSKHGRSSSNSLLSLFDYVRNSRSMLRTLTLDSSTKPQLLKCTAIITTEPIFSSNLPHALTKKQQFMRYFH